VVRAGTGGYVSRCDALDVGVAALRLGAGRERTDDVIDPGVGIRIEAKLGDEVGPGDALAIVRYADEDRLGACLTLLERAYTISDAPTPAPP
ncbi:MAG: hypothetical protein GWN79_00750, partial [Actinobacteria bacterium]|nr:hypothetical protein [Actinomycetota bacterium]NIS28677.1 hypothetical protein [Actinomycetota bacterium]NIT94081.1 hypothetical protein [Actinomycetota bacterium]NIU17707.1 hypothetical protein [Actinomycetota bacterium]NIU64134.1 hypothetical protein [Actinomycetota bacterium]